MNKRRTAWLGQQTNSAMDKRDTGTIPVFEEREER